MRQRTACIISAVIVVLGAFRVALPAWSATLSGAAQRMTVYGGAVTITPGRHCSVDIGTSCTTDSFCPLNQRCVGTLEFGAAGVDITSDMDIVLRPGTAPSSGAVVHSTAFSGSGSTSNIQNLTVSGNVSIMNAGKAICLQGVCKTAWNRNLESWIERSVSMGSWTLKFLEPSDLTRGVSIGAPGAAFTAGTAVNADGLFAANRGGGYAASLGGNIVKIQDLLVLGRITMNPSVQPFSDQNDGLGSGLNASKLDGVAVTLRNGYACDATMCVCFKGTPTHHANIGMNQADCIPLYAGINVAQATLPSPY